MLLQMDVLHVRLPSHFNTPIQQLQDNFHVILFVQLLLSDSQLLQIFVLTPVQQVQDHKHLIELAIIAQHR